MDRALVNQLKGVVLGISCLVTIVGCFALALALGFAELSPLEPIAAVVPGELTLDGVVLLVFLMGLPPAIAFGVLLGSMTVGGSKALRTATYVAVALLTLVLGAPFWPSAMPFAVPITIGHAILLARWTTPGYEPRLPENLAVQKGAVLGLSAAVVVTAITVATAVGENVGRNLLGSPWFVDRHDPTARQLMLTTLMHGVPFGILWGALIGRIAHDMAGNRWTRLPTVLVTAFSLPMLFCVLEPILFASMTSATLFHTLVLLRWTKAAPALPCARVAE